jgi:hypothetical protein
MDMKVKIILFAVLIAGAMNTVSAQCMVGLTTALHQGSGRMETQDEQLKNNFEDFNNQRQYLRAMICEIVKSANLNAIDGKFNKTFDGEDFKLKVKKEKDGDMKFKLTMDQSDLVYEYEMDNKKNDVKVNEYLSSPCYEYAYKKKGDDVSETLYGTDFNYLYDKDGNDVTKTYASEDHYWSLEEDAPM